RQKVTRSSVAIAQEVGHELGKPLRLVLRNVHVGVFHQLQARAVVSRVWRTRVDRNALPKSRRTPASRSPGSIQPCMTSGGGWRLTTQPYTSGSRWTRRDRSVRAATRSTPG